jgi:hypothetical protein
LREANLAMGEAYIFKRPWATASAMCKLWSEGGVTEAFGGTLIQLKLSQGLNAYSF